MSRLISELRGGPASEPRAHIWRETCAYSNTGGQASKATPRAAIAKFAAAGKRTPKKDLGLIASAYGNIYVAQIAMGADNAQAVKAFAEAEAHEARPDRDGGTRRDLRGHPGRRPATRGRLPGPRLSALRTRPKLSIRVLLADDQPLMRTGLRMTLEAEPDIEVVGEAGDGLEAVEAVRRLHPDVVLMDIRMPRLDGLEATRRLSQAPEATPTRAIILTTFEVDEYVFDAVRAGASGFLLKTVASDELVDAVRIVAAGDALLAPSVTRTLIEEFARHTRRATPSPALEQLTKRELEVLILVARGLSNARIAAKLFVSEATVKTHVGHLLMKLEVRDRVQLVVFAYESDVVQPGS